MVARHDQGARAAAGALLRALLCALLCALPASAQWDMEGRAQVVGLSDMKAMKALRLLGRDMAPLVAAVEAAGASGAPRAGQPWCNLTTYGHGKSRLQLCNLAAYPAAAGIADGAPCAALSLGVGRAFGGEADLARRHGCRAWVVDPLVRRRPVVAPARLDFLQLPFVQAAAGFHDGRGLVRVPALADALGAARLAALRLDCRGCELGLGAAVEGHAAGGAWLRRVDQLAVRLHLGRRWARGRPQVLAWGRLAFLLRREGLQVVAAQYGPCPGAADDGGSCDKLWAAVGLRCSDARPCAELLFAREPAERAAGEAALPDAGALVRGAGAAGSGAGEGRVPGLELEAGGGAAARLAANGTTRREDGRELRREGRHLGDSAGVAGGQGR